MTRPAPSSSRPAPRGRPGPGRARPAASSRRSSKWPFAIVAAVIVVAGVVAVVASRGGGDDDGGAVATAHETAPVTVTGAALAPTPSGATALVDPAGDPAVGQAVPTLTGVSFDGSPVTIGESGRPTIVAFVAHWCPHCQKEVPLIQRWRSDGSLPATVDWATVSTGVRSDAPNYPPSAWLSRVGWTAPVLADSPDSTAAQAWGLQSFPYLVAVKADGTVAARGIGELTLDEVRQLVTAASGTGGAS